MSEKPRYLLDSNVISELSRKYPSQHVLRFFSVTESDALYLSVLTLGEIRKGIVRKAVTDVGAAYALEVWARKLERTYFRRILTVDIAVANIWGDLAARRSRPVIDTLLAATAIGNQMTLVTRNTRDVADTGVSLYNPWNVA